ncbi:Type I transmembrane sorting receptor [Orbilia oligospora]|uniref:Type I transmembrane sorting receptor n=1 Tax=Orbilia oligospora TaxID=2813651 RepID=A0A7C8UKJ3_ORBOL|nr:Type I transmembrane sorting receptor [Orbilia oligospora]
MHYSSTTIIVTVLSVAGSVVAVPIEDSFLGFSIPVTHNFLEVNHNGPKSFNDAIRKWGVEKDLPTGEHLRSDLVMHKEVVKRYADSSVTASPESGDVEYTIPVKIGTPPQTLNLNLDTGSSDFPPNSSTWKKLTGFSWSIQYADGSGASGDVGTDKVTIGSTTVGTQVVEIAKTVSSSFTSGGNDGLIGLAYGKLNTVSPAQAKTWFENAMSSLSNKLFTANLYHNKPGSYDFGYIDSKKYTGSIKYTPISTKSGWWEFPSTSYKVGGTTYSNPSTATGIADTGTTLLLVSSGAAKAYYKTISGAQANSQVGGYILPCAKSSSLPAFYFSVGSNLASVSGANVIYGSSLGTIGGVSYCFGAIQPISGNQYIFGDVFFKQNFGVFDYGRTRFGFAPHPYT